MISARSGVWLRSAGPGGCWWKTDGLPTLHILVPLIFALAMGRGGDIVLALPIVTVDTVYIGELHRLNNLQLFKYNNLCSL